MFETLRVLAPLILALLGTVLVAGLGALRPRLAPPLAVGVAALALAATLALPADGQVDLAWAPTWGLHLSFAADGLARLYALLATGIGLAILLYSVGYLPRHLAHGGHGPPRGVRFYALILLFMTAMLGLVMAQDLILLIVFWDLTAITSYFLIGFDAEEAESRRAALTALLVTGISAILLIAAGAILGMHFGTADIPTILSGATPGTLAAITGVLIAVAALAKSAQVPLHFWLPQAMAAPTPVSAYLHSAAMVAAGVFLLGRMHQLLALTPWLMDALVVGGFFSLAVGGVLALGQKELKRLLAYSTVSQYGYVVVLLGLGGPSGTAGAALYVLAHALMKSALFMTAGAVTEATGENELDRLGGLWRRMPALAVGSALAASGLAALPLTLGFFKDEVFFVAGLERGGVVPVLEVVGAALTFAYAWRFWGGIFTGPPRGETRPIPVTLTAPILILGFLTGVGGIVPGPGARVAEAAGATMAGVSAPLDLAYHLDPSGPTLMALAAWVLGLALVLTARSWAPLTRAIAAVSAEYGPQRIYDGALAALNWFSYRISFLEVRNLQQRTASILIAAAALVGVTIILAPPWPAFRVGRLPVDDWPLVLFLTLAALAALLATRTSGRLTLVLTLSAVGYSLAAVFTFFGAPSVALVAVLIETTMTLLLLGVLSLLPRDAAVPAQPLRGTALQRTRLVGLLAGGFAFVITWGVLSQPAPDPSVSRTLIELTPAAHAGSIVTAILADFRGLDTMGEITVIGIALLGVLTLFVGRRTK